MTEKMNCATCARTPDSVPRYYFEAAQTAVQRANRRLWFLVLALILLLVGSNAAWIWYESQFETVSVEQEVDTGEGDAFVVGNGDLNYGKDQAESNKAIP